MSPDRPTATRSWTGWCRLWAFDGPLPPGHSQSKPHPSTTRTYVSAPATSAAPGRMSRAGLRRWTAACAQSRRCFEGDGDVGLEVVALGTLGERSEVLYRRNLATLVDALDRGLGSATDVLAGVTWVRPAGGFFVRITLPVAADAAALEVSASEFGVLWTPMSLFHVGEGAHTSFGCRARTSNRSRSRTASAACVPSSSTCAVPGRGDEHGLPLVERPTSARFVRVKRRVRRRERRTSACSAVERRW